MSHKPFLRRQADERARMPKAIVLRGDFTPELVAALKAKVNFTGNVAMESMQIEQAREHQAVMSLFVVKPKQTGLAATAAMTAQAIKNPDKASVYVLHEDDTTPDVTLDEDRLIEVLNAEGVDATKNFDEVCDKINHFVDETGDLAFYEEVPAQTN